jgi:SAM-dependent methyltransferase
MPEQTTKPPRELISTCYNCGSEQNTFYLQENSFTLVKCTGCGLLFVSDRPAEGTIREAVAAGLHHGNEDLDVTVRFNRDAIARYRTVLRDIYGADVQNFRSWLDVGCGYGEFLLSLQHATGGQIALKGHEPNRRKQAAARRRGLDVSDFDLATHPGHYDSVSLLNVYSHLAEPVKFLTLVRQLLNPGGELLLETGDSADFSPDEIMRPLGLPDHLSFASERILSNILTRLGFQILCVRKYPYLYRDAKTIAKEAIKLVLPGFHSSIRYYRNWKRYSQTNMYIRARLGD